MNNKIQLIILLHFSVFMISCSPTVNEPQNCLSYKKEYVNSVTAPSTASPDESVAIEVKFYVHNGCGSFQRFIETGDLYSKTIEVEARYEGCICAEIMLEITQTYYFIAGPAGEYELKFRSSENELLIVNISVE